MVTTTSIDRPNSIDNSRQLSIARNFVLQYYTFLNKAPHLAHRFYSHDSTLIHGTLEKPGEKKTDPCVGLDKIKEKIDDLELNDCRVKIKQIDSLETLGRGLVIQVIGELSNNGAPMRRFLQTFVLAPGPDETSRQQNNNTAAASVSHTSTTNVKNEHHHQQQQQTHHHHHHHQQQNPQQNQHNHSYQTNTNASSAPTATTGSLTTSDHSNEKYYVLNNIFRYQDDGIDEDEISSSNINTSLDNPNHISSSSSSSVPAAAAISNSNASTNAPISSAPPSVPTSTTATITPTSNTSATAPISTPSTVAAPVPAPATTTTTPTTTTAPAPTSAPAPAPATTTNTTTSNSLTASTTPNAPTTNANSFASTTTTTSNTPTSTTTTSTPTTASTATTTSISSATTTTSYALSDLQASTLKKDVHNNTNSSSEPKTWANMVSKQTPRGQNRQNRDGGPTTPALNSDGGDFRMKEKYPDENQVFVGNLTPEISEDDLRESFKVFGTIQAVRLSKGNFSKSGKPTPDFGFIVFDNPAIVQNILQKKFMTLKNQRLNIEPKRSIAKSNYNNFGRGSRPNSYASRGSREHKTSNHQQQPPLPAPSAQQQLNQPQQSHQPQLHMQDQLPQHQQQNQHRHQHHQPHQQQANRSHKNAPAI